ncbi:hypothetical protein B9G53_21060 [Pseudanabaena sp. SR411]|uniref:hypothetical protein n=1 Tax=Pseudanabaena sp. SR411 TaxID=1980935 RepID=UPI000B97F769|nr:hypothetical protein [Pseudanabaena sp. SR411]OYQ62651.1 hypothetical protein B9G53_21060 [Pseudanabaena sp. SR411]
MDTQLVCVEVDLQNHYTVPTLYQAIEDELQKYGQPLQWIVLSADKERQKVCVKALCLSSDSNPLKALG